MRPKFSIITVTYNAADTIERTLQSVQEQTYGDYEHIIVDGQSTDGTMDIVKNYTDSRRMSISEPDKGIYDAMNKGISNASGAYVIFLNAGDKFHTPDTLKQYAETIDRNDQPGIVYGQTVLVDDHGNYLGKRHLEAPETLTLESMRTGMVVCHQAMAVNSKIVVLFNLKYKYSSDYEWAIICLQHSRNNVYIPDVTIDYLSEGTTTNHHAASLVERFKIMCCYFGVLPTIGKHIGFAVRYLSRRGTAANKQ